MAKIVVTCLRLRGEIFEREFVLGTYSTEKKAYKAIMDEMKVQIDLLPKKQQKKLKFDTNNLTRWSITNQETGQSLNYYIFRGC
mgnify:CR=1 FL=1